MQRPVATEHYRRNPWARRIMPERPTNANAGSGAPGVAEVHVLTQNFGFVRVKPYFISSDPGRQFHTQLN